MEEKILLSLDELDGISGGYDHSLYQKHKIKKGETWKSIANKFGTSARHLASINGCTTHKKLVAGKSILVPIPVV